MPDLADPERDVVVDSLRPPVEICESVRGRQAAAQRLLVLRVAHPLQAADVVDRRHAHPALENIKGHFIQDSIGKQLNKKYNSASF